jgi:hypothetical protein
MPESPAEEFLYNARYCIMLAEPKAGRNLISPRLAVALGLVARAGGF